MDIWYIWYIPARPRQDCSSPRAPPRPCWSRQQGCRRRLFGSLCTTWSSGSPRNGLCDHDRIVSCDHARHETAENCNQWIGHAGCADHQYHHQHYHHQEKVWKSLPVHSTSKRDTGPSKSLHLVSHTPGHQGDAHHDGNHRCHHRCCCFWALRPWHPPPKSHHRHDDDYECVLPHYLDCWTRTILMMISDVFIRDDRGQKGHCCFRTLSLCVCLFLFLSRRSCHGWTVGSVSLTTSSFTAPSHNRLTPSSGPLIRFIFHRLSLSPSPPSPSSYSW